MFISKYKLFLSRFKGKYINFGKTKSNLHNCSCLGEYMHTAIQVKHIHVDLTLNKYISLKMYNKTQERKSHTKATAGHVYNPRLNGIFIHCKYKQCKHVMLRGLCTLTPSNHSFIKLGVTGVYIIFLVLL